MTNSGMAVDLFMFMGQSNMAGRGMVRGREGGLNTARCPLPIRCMRFPNRSDVSKTAGEGLMTGI